jgi:hypothetical protein
MAMTSGQYVQRSIVKRFLREYARPSVLDELIETLEDCNEPEWLDLVKSVRHELVGDAI